MDAGGQIAEEDQERAGRADGGQLVGGHPGRRVGGQPLQGGPLDGAQQDVVDAFVVFGSQSWRVFLIV